MNENVTALPNRAEIKQQAGDWLVILDRGDITVQQQLELQQWLARSDYHREYLEKLAKNWDSMAIMQQLSELFPLQETALQADHSARPAYAGLRQLATDYNRWFTDNTRLAVSGLAAALLLAALLPLLVSTPGQYATGIGEQLTLTLRDGTEVALNTNSRLAVDYTPEHRVVRLLQGEAHFTVEKNPQRPFIVYAGDGLVWAVGTAFNVRYTSAVVDVTVTEGRVKVIPDVPDDTAAALAQPQPLISPSTTPLGAREALIEVGQAVQYNTDNKQITAYSKALSEESMAQKTAWQQGALVFNGEPLSKAIDEISRFTQKQIVIADPALSDIRVGGYYKLNNIEALLASLSEGFNFQVDYINDQRIELTTAD